MTPDTFGDRKVWVILLVGALAAFAVLKLLGCGGSHGPAREAARITRFTVEANCPDLMPVGECLAQIDERAKQADELLGQVLDGGLR